MAIAISCVLQRGEDLMLHKARYYIVAVDELLYSSWPK